MSPKKYFGKKAIELVDVKLNSKIIFNSVKELTEYIKSETNLGISLTTINKYANSKELLRDKWILNFIDSLDNIKIVKNNLDLFKRSATESIIDSQETDKELVGEVISLEYFNSELNSIIKTSISVELTETLNNTKLIFKSLTEAANHIKSETGKGTPEGLKYALDKGTLYLNIYLVKEINESFKITDLKTNEVKFFVTLKKAAEWIDSIIGECKYTGLHWSYKNKRPYKKRFGVELVAYVSDKNSF